mmetsp:Transcript_23108/g.48342  ORF Transcript_23108/g.48342 Transcript_23108/m.48342 type:complete len:214 (+) Transcript_23108:107-748(+)
MHSASLLAPVAFCIVAQSASAFQTNFLPVTRSSGASPTSLNLVPVAEIHDSILLPIASTISSSFPSTITVTTSSIILSSEGESWRQYVPLAVSCLVIIDILLGSPIANLALEPMRRASEKGATGDNKQSGDDTDSSGGSLFSPYTGKSDYSSGVESGRGTERVDSNAIAQAALDKAMGTLELKRFLEENKTDEQRYEDVRKKLDQQMRELDEE